MRVGLLSLLLLACAAPASPDQGPPERWTIWIATSAPPAVQLAANDVERYLEAMGREVTQEHSLPPPCVPGQGQIVFVGETLTGPMPTSSDDQAHRIFEERCSGGSLVSLSGNGLLGRQYAAYELLHRWGVRFFHPEQEHVPATPTWPADPVALDREPAFHNRSVSLHLTHPLELGDIFRSNNEAYLSEARRYMEWTLKNGATDGPSGYGTGELEDYMLDRGFPLGAGFALYNQQQGGRGIIDPDDPRSDEEQIAAAIDERMQPRPDGRVPTSFGFTFDPSEFTEIDDQVVVRQITFITNYINEHYPNTEVSTINHGTAQEPTDHYGLRFYSLSQLAPPSLRVRVHTLMFYDLFRPAPVYGNRDFHFLYDFMAEQHETRALTYFPESAWWLTFDIAVPLYLPITIEARDRDLQGIAWMRAGKLDGHHVFGSGHEWGYWQNEYCSLRMSMDLSYRWQDCLRDITVTMGDAGDGVQSVLEEMVALQQRDFFDAEILAYLVGSDPETETAASVGVVFHPLPPAPATIAGWDDPHIARFREIAASLDRIDEDYARLVARLNAIEPMIAESGAPYFREIRDGIEVTGLRARHASQVYGALVTLRESQLHSSAELASRASDLLEDAERTTIAARMVITRREEDYRYHPIERSIGGGENGDEDTNWTVYRYRYLNRTHHAYYYTRIDRLAREVFEGGGEAIGVSDAILAPSDALSIVVRDPSFADPMVDWGDSSAIESTPPFMHSYVASGVYPLHVTGRLGADAFDLRGDVARVDSERSTGFSADIVAPTGIDLVEPLLPSVTIGRIDDTRWAVGFGGTESGAITLGEWSALTPIASSAIFESAPNELRVPVVNHGTGAISAHLVVHDAVVRLDTMLSITGRLDTDAVVDAVVAIGGFEPVGARRLVASTLGFTPDTLPASVDFEVQFTVR